MFILNCYTAELEILIASSSRVIFLYLDSFISKYSYILRKDEPIPSILLCAFSDISLLEIAGSSSSIFRLSNPFHLIFYLVLTLFVLVSTQIYLGLQLILWNYFLLGFLFRQVTGLFFLYFFY